MATGVVSWSQTAATNASADSTINWAEGQAPSSINDSARAMMASIARWRDDISGGTVTSGTSTAYTVTSNQGFAALSALSNQVVAFTPHTTNGGTVTLSVDGLTAKPLRPAPSVELQSGVLVQGTPYAAVYNSTDGVFYLQGVGTAPGIPLGASIDYWGTSAPSSFFVMAYGQPISRTAYAGLFSLFGTSYGSGDGSTTFNVPDLRGRVIAGKGDMGGTDAGRLTSTYFGAVPTSIGAVSNTTDHITLGTSNLPPYTPSGSISVSSNIDGSNVIVSSQASSSSTAGGSQISFPNTGSSVVTFAISKSITFNAQGGTSTPFSSVQPTIIANKLIRII